MGVGEVLTAPHSPWQNPFAERLIGSICRHVARKVAAGRTVHETIAKDQLPEIFGRTRYFEEMANEPDEIGVVTGMAATGAGGDVLFIEASAYPGKGNLTLTGKLGDVNAETFFCAARNDLA